MPDRSTHDFLKVILKPHASKSDADPDMDPGSEDDAADPKDMKVSCMDDFIKAIHDSDSKSAVKYLDELMQYDPSSDDDDKDSSSPSPDEDDSK